MRLLALLLFAACPAWAEGGPSAESIERLKQAIVAAGCKVDESNQAAILTKAGMEEAEAGVIVSLLAERGEVEMKNDSLHLKSAACK